MKHNNMNVSALNINHLVAPVTFALMAGLVVTACYAHFNPKLRLKLVLHPVSVVKDKQYYRLLSSDFIHHDFAHLMLNLLLLYGYGGNLEDYLNQKSDFGSLEYLGIYLFSCLSGTVLATLIHRKDSGFTSAGASGSLMGCMFSYVLLQPHRTAFYLPVAGPVENLYFGLISIILLIVYQWKSKNELISHEQHFFGALGGITMTLLLFPGLIR